MKYSHQIHRPCLSSLFLYYPFYSNLHSHKQDLWFYMYWIIAVHYFKFTESQLGWKWCVNWYSVNDTLKWLVHGQGYVTESGKWLLQFIFLFLKQCRTINWVWKLCIFHVMTLRISEFNWNNSMLWIQICTHRKQQYVKHCSEHLYDSLLWESAINLSTFL